MRGGIILTVMLSVAALLASVLMAQAQTCADQHQARLKRGHTVNECTTSTERCLKTGRWVGPAGNGYTISRKK